MEKISEVLRADQLIPHPDNEKLYGTVIPDAEMTESIRQEGILQRLLVTPKDYFGEGNCLRDDYADGLLDDVQYVIISGHRRFVNGQVVGLEDFPCDIAQFPTLEEMSRALIESNRQRDKTYVQICNEIEALSDTLSKDDIRNEMHRVSAVEDAEESGAGSRVPDDNGSGRTADVIAEHLAISERKVRKVLAVFSQVKRDEFFESMDPEKRKGRQKKEHIERYKECALECLRKWGQIEQDCLLDKVSLNAAYKEIVKLKREMESFIYDRRKTAEPKAAAKHSKPKPVALRFERIEEYDPDTDGEFNLLHSMVGEESDVEMGTLEMGMSRRLAVRRGDAVATLDWEQMFAAAVPALE